MASGLKKSLSRRVIAATKGMIDYDFGKLYHHQLVERPHYAYCILNAARLALRLGQNRISLIEFGVAGGNGLLAAERLSKAISDHLGGRITFEIYGFDTGEGMPEVQDYRDLPYWFQRQQYAMDFEKLRGELATAKLVIGNVEDTVTTFFETHDPTPIGAMFFDLDYYSSTMSAFKIFDERHFDRYFLPRLFLYMDDVIGQEFEMYGEFNGPLAAIKDFNTQHENAKIHLNQNLLSRSDVFYRYQIYYAHLLSHRDYSKYVGGQDQEQIQDLLKLKA